MRACILAAGIGQRLRPITDDRPKALVEIDGLSFSRGDPSARRGRRPRGRDRERMVRAGARGGGEGRAVAGAPLPQRRLRSDAEVVSLHVCRDALFAGGAEDTFKLDGDVILDVEVLRRLVDLQRSTSCGLAVAVDERGAEAGKLGAEEMKVTLDPPGPWGGVRARSIGDFGKGLDPKTSAGESIGVELIAAPSMSSIFDAVGAAVTVGDDQIYYEDVYARLLRARGGLEAPRASLDARGVRVGDLPWGEVDTAEDLARAVEIARRTRLS